MVKPPARRDIVYMESPEPLSALNQERFIALFARSEPDIRRYIYSLTHNRSDTEDIIQNTSIALLRKFNSFDDGKPFRQWAFGFAYKEVLKHREKVSRRRRLCLQTIEALAKEHEQDDVLISSQRQSLEYCLQKVSDDNRNLIKLRYQDNLSVKAISEKLGEPSRKMYRLFEKIRDELIQCANQRLAEEG